MTTINNFAPFQKPMLAATIENVADLKFGVHDNTMYKYYGTTKLDGIRCLKTNNGPVTRAFKPIPNKSINAILSNSYFPAGLDGELLANNSTFQESTGHIMRRTGTPDFTYYIFDYVSGELSEPYLDRIEKLKQWHAAFMANPNIPEEHKSIVKLVLPTVIQTKEELDDFEEACLTEGFEGVILRSATSPYKEGRSTFRERYLLKLKQFKDSEGTIVGFEEYEHNNNAATTNVFGRTERSSHKANKTPGGMLGTLVIKDIHSGCIVRVGSGFDFKLRKDIWENQDKYKSELVKYKYFPVGLKDKPRHPVFIGFRHALDMSQDEVEESIDATQA